MCKKNQPGCIGCCKPVTDRVDPFDSWWKCWKGDYLGGTPPTYDTVLPWLIDTGTGEAYQVFSTTANSNKEANVDMVRFVLPFSVEYRCTIVSLPGSQNRSLRLRFADVLNSLGGPVSISAAVLVSGNSSGISSGNASYVHSSVNNTGTFSIPSAIALPVTVRMRAQFDTDGITYWVHLNGSAPSLSLGQPFGVKQTGSMPGTTLSSTSKARIGLTVSTSTTTVGNEYARLDNFEAHIWNHIVDPRAWP